MLLTRAAPVELRSSGIPYTGMYADSIGAFGGIIEIPEPGISYDFPGKPLIAIFRGALVVPPATETLIAPAKRGSV